MRHTLTPKKIRRRKCGDNENWPQVNETENMELMNVNEVQITQYTFVYCKIADCTLKTRKFIGLRVPMNQHRILFVFEIVSKIPPSKKKPNNQN